MSVDTSSSVRIFDTDQGIYQLDVSKLSDADRAKIGQLISHGIVKIGEVLQILDKYTDSLSSLHATDNRGMPAPDGDASGLGVPLEKLAGDINGIMAIIMQALQAVGIKMIQMQNTMIDGEIKDIKDENTRQLKYNLDAAELTKQATKTEAYGSIAGGAISLAGTAFAVRGTLKSIGATKSAHEMNNDLHTVRTRVNNGQKSVERMQQQAHDAMNEKQQFEAAAQHKQARINEAEQASAHQEQRAADARHAGQDRRAEEAQQAQTRLRAEINQREQARDGDLQAARNKDGEINDLQVRSRIMSEDVRDDGVTMKKLEGDSAEKMAAADGHSKMSYAYTQISAGIAQIGSGIGKELSADPAYNAAKNQAEGKFIDGQMQISFMLLQRMIGIAESWYALVKDQRDAQNQLIQQEQGFRSKAATA